MKKLALAAFLSLGLTVPALAQDTTQEAAENAQYAQQTTQGTTQDDGMARQDIPTAEDATLRECQAWLDQLNVTIEDAREGDGDVLAQAEQRQDEVAQACDAGNYHEGILMAAETIDMITGDDQN